MKRLPILSGVVLLAAAALWGLELPLPGQKTPPEKPAEAETEKTAPDTAERPENASDARALVSSARRKLQSYRSIRAEIEQKIILGDRRMKATGTYLQARNPQGTGLKLRLEFQVRFGLEGEGGMEGRLIQVSDGQILWTQHQIGQEIRVTRRNIRQILDAAKNAGMTRENDLVTQLGLGGLPALLASIERNMTFQSLTTEKLNDREFHVVHAVWNEEFLNTLRNRQIIPVQNPDDRLPEHVPESLQIYYEKEELFPRRIVYLKKHPSRDISLPMVDLRFRNVEINPPVDEQQFVFKTPEGVFTNDITPTYLELLKPQAAQPQQ